MAHQEGYKDLEDQAIEQNLQMSREEAIGEGGSNRNKKKEKEKTTKNKNKTENKMWGDTLTEK